MGWREQWRSLDRSERQNVYRSLRKGDVPADPARAALMLWLAARTARHFVIAASIWFVVNVLDAAGDGDAGVIGELPRVITGLVLFGYIFFEVGRHLSVARCIRSRFGWSGTPSPGQVDGAVAGA